MCMVANLFGPDLGFVVLIVLVVLIGGSQLPKIARNVGMAGKEFRKAQQEADEEAERERVAKAASAASPQAPTPPPPVEVGPAPADVDDSLRLTRAELDALLKAREEQVRREAGGSSETAAGA